MDIDDIKSFEDFKQALRSNRHLRQLEQFRHRLGVLIGVPIAVILLLVGVFSSYYTVEPEEVGVVTRFGRFVRETPPGLHFKWPLGVEAVVLIRKQQVHKEEFGFRTEQAGVRTRYSPSDYSDESLMLTGDLNIADVEWIVQYRISDPELYLFNIRDPERALRDASESVMREVVGDRSVTEVLTVGRTEINSEVKERLQGVLDMYGTGLNVVTVKLQDVNPPDPVKPAFNEVNQARQEKEEAINQAQGAYNKVIPLAEGEALQAVTQAEGYATERVNMAKGDTNRFLAVLAEYEKASEVTRQRLYLETMAKVLPGLERKILIDPSSGAGPLPLLHLSEEGIRTQGGER